MNSLVSLSRQKLQEYLSPDKLHENSPNEMTFALSEVDFDPSYLLSLMLREIKIPFIRIRLSISHFDMQIISNKGDVVNTVPCTYQDDRAILDCIDSREIPESIQDLLLHPKARRIFWNGLVFVEICNKNGSEKDGIILPYKVTTVLKCSTNMMLCYAENAYRVAKQSDEPNSSVKNEENLLLALHPDLDLEVPKTKKTETENCSNSAKYQRLQLRQPKNKYRFRGATETRLPHAVLNLRKSFPIQNRLRHLGSSGQVRKTKFRSLLEEPFCTVPENSAEILSKKWKDVHSLYRLKNPENDANSSVGDQTFPVDHIPEPRNKAPGFCVVPEEKHTIEAIASSHCAEIVISRRSADNFYFGQLKVMSRQRVTNESLKSTTSATITSPTLVDSGNSAANERLCEFELGSRQSVNKYIVEYLRMISDRDRTPKHSINNLRK